MQYDVEAEFERLQAEVTDLETTHPDQVVHDRLLESKDLVEI
ncbi:hypothetical protein [Burkholderia sp. Bp9143]|nr:hypothetical protein [Burkholderia sp. Bp9143]